MVNNSLRVRSGMLVGSRLFDVGYAIDLKAAERALGAGAVRTHPMGVEATAVLLSSPPVTASLGNYAVNPDLQAQVTVRLYDFGAISVQARCGIGDDMDWEAYVQKGRQLALDLESTDLFRHALNHMLGRIEVCVERQAISMVTEDYVVFRARALTLGGEVQSPSLLTDAQTAELLLGESRPLSATTIREFTNNRFSYYADELAVLSWERALVIAPDAGETDTEFVLEFANAQLLELRYYDSLLDGEIARMYDAVEGARRGVTALARRRFTPLLGRLQRLLADTTEVVERVDNALKVTDDVSLARLYATALEIFRGKAWRAGVDRKLGLVRETYGMLNHQAQTARSEVIEWAIVVLFVLEIVLPFLHLR